MAPPTPTFERWAAAQAEASDAEFTLRRAQAAEADGTGPPVPESEVLRAETRVVPLLGLAGIA